MAIGPANLFRLARAGFTPTSVPARQPDLPRAAGDVQPRDNHPSTSPGSLDR